MKKYIGTISLALATVLVISIFYATGANANKNLPQYEIQQTAGDSDIELEAIGNLQIGALMTHAERKLTIDKTGAAYKKPSLFSDNYYEMDVDELREKYPGFMRRKNEQSSENFYEDEKRIAYAADRSFDEPALNIGVYDKGHKKAEEFELELPKFEHGVDYINIYRIALFNNKMKVIGSVNYTKEDRHYEELYMFTIDLQKEGLISKKKIYATDGDSETESTYISFPSLIKSGKRDSRFIYEVMKDIYKNEEEEPVRQEREYYNLNLETEKLKKIDSKVAEEKMDPVLVKGDALYSLKQENDQVTVQMYDISSGKDLKTFSFKFDEKLSSEGNVQLDMKKEKLILYTSEYVGDYSNVGSAAVQSKLPQIIVADANDGKILYQGKIKLKAEQELDTSGFELQIMEVKLK